MACSSTPPTCDTYIRKKDNDLTLGPLYEDLVVFYSFLTLEDNQALAREIGEPTKFDDIVIRVTNEHNQQHEYYYRQLKHKDTMKNTEQTITWNDLLGNDKKNAFCLKEYFDSYMKLSQEEKSSNWIKELSILTTVGFARGPGKVSNLVEIALSLLAGQPKRLPGAKQKRTEGLMTARVKYYVTQEDISSYFEELTHGGISMILDSKRYKFSQLGVNDVTQSLLATNAIKQQNAKEFEAFLNLLVFHVETPHLNKLLKMNQALLKLYFPFHWDVFRQEQCFQRIKEKVLELFRPLPGGSHNVAKWATAKDRRTIFKQLIPELKQDVPLGSTTAYEAKALTRLYNQLKFKNIFKDKSIQNSLSTAYICSEVLQDQQMNNIIPLPIVNISSEKSNATVFVLKMLNAIRQSKDNTGDNTLIIQVLDDEQGVQNVIEHFKKLSEEVQRFTDIKRERFYLVLEVSPFFEPLDKTTECIKRLFKDLASLKDLRSWIQFVVVTQQPIQDDANETVVDLVSIGDLPLKWSDLTEETRNCLYEKTLFLRGNRKVLSSPEAPSLEYETDNTEAIYDILNRNEEISWKTSLKALGLDKESIGDWLCPLSLGELITHNEERPLCLALPEYDADLEAMYIARQVQIPLVKLNRMDEELRNRIVFDEGEFNEEIARDETKTYHLLERLEPSSRNSDLMWLKSNGRASYEELKPHVTKSKDSNWSFHELELILDGTYFGSTGSADDKLVIVVDLPGKGKTCLLTSLSNQFVKQQSAKEQLDCLMLRINLLEVKPTAWEEEKIGFLKNEMAAISFLLNNLFSTEDLNVLDATIIKQMCLNSSASIFVLLDGFDEINDDQRSIIYKLIDQLLLGTKGIKRIILTSRPDNGLEEKLQKHFQQFPLHLRNFTKQDQIDFLVKRWSMRLQQDAEDAAGKPIDDDDEAAYILLRKYAEELIKHSRKALTDEDSKSFLDIPLQCMIVSECFFKDLKEYIVNIRQDSNWLPTFQDENFVLLHLYNQFYDTKFDILFEEKAKISSCNDAALFVRQDYKEHYIDAMTRLSVFQIMNDIQDAEVLCRSSWLTYRNARYGKDLKRGRKLGVIQSLDENSIIIENLDAPLVKFIHRTFAEYFFAKYLIQAFIQTDSELLVGRAFYDSETLDATYKIITQKIFVYTEYAGIVRFFDRMLEEHIIPPVPAISDEESLFSKKNRQDVMKEWPVISHDQFNRFLAKTLASECSEMFATWTMAEIDQFDSTKLLVDNIKVSKEKYEKDQNESPLFSLLTSDLENKKSNVITLLIHCIKEYASRRDVSDYERKALAHCVTLTLLTWVDKQAYDCYDRRYTALFMQWYDPAKELSNEQNSLFSEWFLKMVYYYVTKKTSRISYCVALGMACSRMTYHRHYLPDFQDHVKKLVESIFHTSPKIIANGFFITDSIEITGDAKVAREKSRHFVYVLSLSTLTSPYDDSLLKLQVNWFRALLDTFIGKLERDDLLILKTINPFAIVGTTEFLIMNIKKLVERSPPAAADYLMEMKHIAASALKYFNDVLPFLLKPIVSKGGSNGYNLDLVCNILWYLMLSDKIISFLPDEPSRRQAFLSIFFTAIGRWSLIAFADVDCCQRSFITDNRRLVIYFPSEMYKSEKTRKRFEDWLNHLLKIVWQEKSEREFIDFLFVEIESPFDEFIEQDKFSLCALPCLLFSNMVSPYIPDQLSPDGLEYIEKTFENICLPETGKSLLDSIMQQVLTPCNSKSCRHKNEEQVETLKEET